VDEIATVGDERTAGEDEPTTGGVETTGGYETGAEGDVTGTGNEISNVVESGERCAVDVTSSGVKNQVR
jgi:hypothetical protein